MNIPACVKISRDDLKKLKFKDNVNICCPTCNTDFTRTKFRVLESLRQGQHNFYCTSKCRYKAVTDKRVIKKCLYCGSTFTATKLSNAKFCSQSCAATFNNTHKTYGIRRSRLEIWIEAQLKKKYNFEIVFNQKNAINSELDIFIPRLKLAFELNGIFHYKPIHGQELLKSIINNDKLKAEACRKQDIELHTINTSSQQRFTEKSSETYLNIVCQVIDEKWHPREDSNL